jgi:hypothetical protein
MAVFACAGRRIARILHVMGGSAAEAPTSPDTPPVPLSAESTGGALPADRRVDGVVSAEAVPPPSGPAPPPFVPQAPVPPGQPPPWPGKPPQQAPRAASVHAVPDVSPGSVRASDADRAEAVDALREEFAAGRLSHQTFLFRMNAAMEARHVQDLPPLLADLPPAPPARTGVLGRVQRTLRRWTGRQADLDGTVDPASAASSQGAARRMTSALRLPPAAASRPGVPPSPLPFPRTNEGFYTIGRDPRNDLSIEDMSVSRIHARLERSPSGWLLKDLSSTNGTRVNGWRVRGQVAVRAGDVVRFGDIEFVLTEDTGNGQRAERPQVPTH